jgi:hypothetical protein
MYVDEPPLPARIQVEVPGAGNLRCQMGLLACRPPLAAHRASMMLDCQGR